MNTQPTPPTKPLVSFRLPLTTRSHNPKTPNHHKFYSPKLLTRRTERKNIPSTAFLRRKDICDPPHLYKYLSPKKLSHDDQCTFFSDQLYGNFTQRAMHKTGFELDFSRINAQMSEYTMAMSRSYEARNLFQDMRDQVSDSYQNQPITERIRTIEIDEKHFPSFDTTSQSFHLKQNKKVEEWFSVIVKENGKLKKQLETIEKDMEIIQKDNLQLKEQIQILRVKKQQFEHEIDKKQLHFEQVKEELMRAISRLQDKHDLETAQLRKTITQHQEKLSSSEKEAFHQHKLLSNLYSRLYQLESQCQDKQLHFKTLNDKIQQLNNDLHEKCEYNVCLEDVILQLNQKIDELRRENFKIADKLEDKKDQLEELRADWERQGDIILMNETEISILKDKLQDLKIDHGLLEMQHSRFVSNSKNSSLSQISPEQLSVMASLRDEITTLQSVLDIEREHNEKLKKEISYNHVELTFLKKNQHQNEKNSKEVEILKERNKKLLKKVNQLMEDISEMKEQIEEMRKKSKNEGSIKKILGPVINEDTTKNNKQKARFASQRTNLHHPEGEASNHKLKKNSKNDSDEELSFKLSPQRK